jgi:plasmid stabilization system protein ParE
MTQIVYAPAALADLDRLCEFLLESGAASATATGAIILRGIEVLAEHPLIGRPVEAGMRELIISRGHTGYVALYRFDVAKDQVLLLAIRHQREAGYA